MLLADYSGRLAAEIDDRRQLTRLLALFLQSQRDGLAKNEQKLEVRTTPSFLLFCFSMMLDIYILANSYYINSFFLQFGFLVSTRGQH